MSEPVLLQLDRIVSDTEAWPRHDLDTERVALFVDLYADGDLAVLPPLEVAALPTGEFLLTDGWHRLEALEVEQALVILADPGQLSPWRFAYQRGLETCTTASRPLTRDERRAATERLLTDRPELTDVAIAQLVGVSNATVGRARHRLQNPTDPHGQTDQADRGDQHAQAGQHTKTNRQLVRQLTKLWESRPLLMAAGLRDTAALGDSLGHALIEAHGPRDAGVWAQRLSTWAQRAATVTDRAAAATADDEPAGELT